MFTVTEAASARLAEILQQKDLPEEVAVRFVHEGGQIRLQSDNEQPGDTTFKHEGRTVLLLDTQVSELLANETLDIEGPGLTLRGADDGL
jgi:Fe-S cluster assembly iron-binding protein IscA